MINTNKLDALKGTKFLFDDNLISYAELMQLLENNGLNTKFIKKPLEENLKVHSLYIKSDFEVAYLAHSNSAEDIYANAGDFIKQYTETTLYEVLKSLGCCDIKSSSEITSNKQKKSKFIIVTNGDNECIIKKKNILYVSYNERYKKIHFQFKNNCIEAFCITEEKYTEIKSELMS